MVKKTPSDDKVIAGYKTAESLEPLGIRECDKLSQPTFPQA
jgi:hypothetical protein